MPDKIRVSNSRRPIQSACLHQSDYQWVWLNQDESLTSQPFSPLCCSLMACIKLIFHYTHIIWCIMLQIWIWNCLIANMHWHGKWVKRGSDISHKLSNSQWRTLFNRSTFFWSRTFWWQEKCWIIIVMWTKTKEIKEHWHGFFLLVSYRSYWNVADVISHRKD